MENKKYLEFFNTVEKYNSICIFGHVFPDGDCYGSTEGLKLCLKALYPNKNIYVIGTDISKLPSFFPYADIVSDDVIKNSLVITCDLPDKARCGDKRAFTLPNLGIIKIDHHIFKENFGGLEIVEDEASSACEIIAKIFYTKFTKLPLMACNVLYYGFTTDTNRFLYSTKESAKIGLHLIEDGAQTNEIYEAVNRVSEQSIKFLGYLYTHYQKTDLGVSYCFIPFNVSKEYGYNPHSCALFVNSIGRIQASRISVIIAETEDGKAFCEFRSIGNIDVQKIAAHFTGGGHLNASGCTLSSYNRKEEVIEECENALFSSFAPYSKELKVMLEAAKASSKKIMEIYKAGFDVEIKNDNSPVTTADFASDKIIRSLLTKEFPNYGFLSEEDKDDLSRLEKEKIFIVDPLDGTKDFVSKDDMFATNIALVENGKPVVSVVSIPARSDIYFAVYKKGSYVFSPNKMIKRLNVSHKVNDLIVLNSAHHKNMSFLEAVKSNKKVKEIKYVGSALKACLIAEGKAEITYSLGEGTKEWDTCAPQLILLEANGSFTDNFLHEITYNKKDVYNHNGFTALNSKDNCLFTKEEIESFIKNK